MNPPTWKRLAEIAEEATMSDPSVVDAEGRITEWRRVFDADRFIELLKAEAEKEAEPGPLAVMD